MFWSGRSNGFSNTCRVNSFDTLISLSIVAAVVCSGGREFFIAAFFANIRSIYIKR